MTPRTRRLLIAGAIGGAALLLLAPVALLIAVDRGGADGLAMKALSAKLQRPVRFARMHPHLLTGDPTVVLDDLVIGSPPEITRDDLLHARRVVVHLRLGDILVGRFAPTALALDGVELRLVRLGPGRNNYTLGKGGTGGLLAGMKSLALTDARMRMTDPDRQTAFAGTVSHDGRPGVASPFALNAAGDIRGGAVTIALRGGPLNGRPPDAPWPLQATLVDGDARLQIAGASQKPFDFRGFDFDTTAAGPNLADVGYLVGTATPNSRPFSLTAHVNRTGRVIRLTRIAGRIGGSDLAGSVVSDHSRARRRMTADLRAGTLRAEDVAAVLAPAPPHAETRSAARQASHAPSKDPGGAGALPVDGLKKLDGALDLRAGRVLGYLAPLTDFTLRARLQAGRLAVTPVSFGLAPGRVAGGLTIDAAHDRPVWTLTGHLAGARLGALKPALARTADGDLDAWADLQGGGDSVRKASASAAGKVAFRISRGRIQRGPAAILGGDLFQAVGLALGDKAATTPLDCAVGEFSAAGGVLSAQRLVIVTGAGATQGTGRIDLGRGAIDLSLKGLPTRRRLLRLDAPVTVTGPLAHPKVGLDKGRALRQVGIAGALAVVATPLAAVIPFVGRTAATPDCGALLADSARYVGGARR